MLISQGIDAEPLTELIFSVIFSILNALVVYWIPNLKPTDIQPVTGPIDISTSVSEAFDPDLDYVKDMVKRVADGEPIVQTIKESSK